MLGFDKRVARPGSSGIGLQQLPLSRVALLVVLLLATLVALGPGRPGLNPLDDLSISKLLPADKGQPGAAYARLPIYFMPNTGQLDTAVSYYASGPGYGFYLTDSGVTYAFTKQAGRGYALKLMFVGANGSSSIVGGEKQRGKVNYFVGKDRANWRRNVPTYRQVSYRNLYDGIDLIYRGDQRRIKYAFVVAPGADHSRIGMRYDGARGLRRDAEGNLRIGTPLGELTDEKPYAYQVVGKKRVRVPASFAVRGDVVGFSVGDHDPRLPLVIDPGLAYSTFLGGTGDELGPGSVGVSNVAYRVDAAGNAYVAGYTNSPDFPTVAGSYDTGANGVIDVFVTKLDSTGSSLSYSTYIGGSGNDYGYGLAVDESGTAYLVGYTASSDFPTTVGAYDTSANGVADAFVAKLDPDGANLAYSTYLGSTSSDFGLAIAVDTTGNAYATGYTSSSSFPVTAGAYQSARSGLYDAFVTKLNAVGSALDYSTFLGGTNHDYGFGVAVDSSGTAYVGGYTLSTNFPTTVGAYDTSQNGQHDLFVTKLNAAGSALDYSTYIGGTDHDHGYALALDASGTAYMSGYTSSADFPTSGAYDSSPNGAKDAFVVGLGATGSTLAYSTFIGGTLDDVGRGLTLSPSGDIYLTGYTMSADFPTTAGAYDTGQNGNNDAFVARLTGAGSTLAYSTFLGGSADDYGYGIGVDAGGNTYVAGETASSDFPTTGGAYDTSANGGREVFAAKLDVITPTTTLTSEPAAPGPTGWFTTPTTVTLSPDESATTYYAWEFEINPTTYTGSIAAPQGDHTLSFWSRDVAGNEETIRSQNFKVDTGNPTDPSLDSSSHTPGAWSNDNTVDVDWSGATDTASGVDGYSVEWSDSSATVPDITKDLEEVAGIGTSPGLTDGDRYFHLRTVDNAGNWSSAVHLGPFKIDTVLPSDPTTVTSPSHTVGAWSNDNTVDVDWSGATDTASGVDGYSVEWSQAAGTVPDDTKDMEESEVSTTSSALGGGDWYFHLRTKDSAGNWTSTAHLGPFKIDTANPDNPAVSSPSHVLGGWSNNATITVNVTGATDGASAVDGFAYAWAQLPTFPVDPIKAREEGDFSASSGAVADGNWYFHLRTRDNAGNWTPTVHIGPFGVDTSPSPAPSLTGGPAAGQVNLSWTASVDGASGVAGYRIYNADTAGLVATTTETSYSVTGLADITTYRYYVKAYDNAGNVSAPSNTVAVTTLDGTPPTAPQNLIGFAFTSSTVELYWQVSTDSVGVAGYKVYRDGSEVSTTTGNSATIAGLSGGTAYAFYVRGFDAGANVSGPSNTVTIKPGAGGATTAGDTQTVGPTPQVSVSFQTIVAPGVTSIGNDTTGSAPEGFQFSGNRYLITTTADTTGPITVAIKYSEEGVQNEAALKLYHWHDGQWKDVTLYVDTANNVIVGRDDELSVWAPVEPAPPPTGANLPVVMALAVMLTAAGIRLIARSNRPSLG